jgi:hypothetical protein
MNLNTNNVQLINLTPHAVVVVGENGEVIMTIPASGQILRLPEVTTPVGEIEGVPLVRKNLDPNADLPPHQEGVYYIVSLPVAQVARREDFLVPDELVRNEQGRVIGCHRFAVVA